MYEILIYWFITILVSSCSLLLCFVRTSISRTILAYAARMSLDDHDDIIFDLRQRYGDRLGLKISALAFEVSQDELESNYDELHDDRKEFNKSHLLNERKFSMGLATYQVKRNGKYITKTVNIRKPLVSLLINPWTKQRLNSVSPKVFYASLVGIYGLNF